MAPGGPPALGAINAGAWPGAASATGRSRVGDRQATARCKFPRAGVPGVFASWKAADVFVRKKTVSGPLRAAEEAPRAGGQAAPPALLSAPVAKHGSRHRCQAHVRGRATRVPAAIGRKPLVQEAHAAGPRDRNQESSQARRAALPASRACRSATQAQVVELQIRVGAGLPGDQAEAGIVKARILPGWCAESRHRRQAAGRQAGR